MAENHEDSVMESPASVDCAIKQVDLTVPKAMIPTCRTEPLTISSISAQIAVVPLGHLMARTLMNRVFLKGSWREFSMNPGPFNIKEHVLITIFANAGAGTVYATHILSAVKLYYKRRLTFIPAFLVMLTTQVLGFGWEGLFRKYLVEPGEMWWPRLQGLGIGSLGFDWSTISSYLGSPLASPWFATANVAIGFFLVLYVMTPLSYWFNVYNSKNFPIFSEDLFMVDGSKYNTSSIINSNFHLDKAAYAKSGHLYLCTFFAMTYGIGFATLSATLVHVLLFNGSDLWKQTRRVFGATIMFACEYYNDILQLPWWGVLLACGIALFFTLPVGIIAATTNQSPGLNIITEYIIGYMYPGRPVANMCFKVYGYISMIQALTFLSDFKLGHYMKIPPRAMFMAQCPMDHVFYDASVIWGLVGPRRIFGALDVYSNVNWFFLGGAIAPLLVWLAHKTFPQKQWIRLIHMPVLLGATAMMPPASAVNYTSWIIVAFLSGYVVFRHRPTWLERYNYVLSGGLDAGTAFMTVLMFIALQSRNIQLNWRGNDVEGCPLASCPTAKGISADGGPAFS
ncbi:unnamed protein product [Ilex paraguariensis]|uniref:Oligopeptide transporter n=1 Tax=Ilex paraguariensis TaxID=185542 RepID=A0ABC8SLX8_9AQUA